jgi:MFS family permease
LAFLTDELWTGRRLLPGNSSRALFRTTADAVAIADKEDDLTMGTTAKRRIFYGWWVLAALVIVGSIGPMARYSISAFFPALSGELGWSRALIGTAQSISLWVYSVVSILTGLMVDRVGSRKTILVGGLFCLVGWLLLSSVNSVWQLYLYYGVVMAVAVSFTHLVPVQSTSRKWFIKRGGLAGGIVGSAFALGTAVFSPLLTTLTAKYGWRDVSLVAALASGIPIMALAWFVVRDTPESVGQRPDGALSTVPLARESSPDHHWSVRDALKTRQFWLLFVVYSLLGIVYNGLLAHLVIWAVDLGSTAAAAGLFVTLFNGPSVVARIVGGGFGDRYGKRRIILIGIAFSLVIALLGWRGLASPMLLGLFAGVIGLGIGFSNTLFAPYLGDLFGRENVGSLFGILTLGWGLVGGVGPLLWGEIFDHTRSYGLALLLSAVCYAGAMATLLMVRPLARREVDHGG